LQLAVWTSSSRFMTEQLIHT